MTQAIELEQLGSELDAMHGRLETQSLQQPLTECSDIVRTGFGESFTSSKSHAGKSWPKRKDPKDKGRSGWASHPLLIDLGELFLAATSQFGSGNITTVAEREAVLGVSGSAIPYAATQQEGSAKKNIPQREYIGATEDTLGVCDEILADYVLNEVIG